MVLGSCITGGYGEQLPEFKPQQLTFTLYDELETIYPDLLPGSPGLKNIALFNRAPAGFYLLADIPESFEDRPLSLQVKHTLGDRLKSMRLSRMRAVPVEFNTGIKARTERIDGVRNPHVIRRAPFWIYEGMEPLDLEDFRLPAGKRTLLHLQIEADGILKRTASELSVELSDGSASIISQTVTVEQYPVTPDSSLEMDYIVWHHHRQMAAAAGTELYSEPWWRELEKYVKLMRKSRQNAFILPWGLMFDDHETADGVEPQWNEQRVDRYLKLFFDNGFKTVSAFHFAGRKNGEWMAKQLTVRGRWDTGSPEADHYLGRAFSQMNTYIEQNSLKEQWLVSISDEPSSAHAEDYLYLSDLVRRWLPGIQILEATKGEGSLIGSVDIWCPTVDKYEENRSFFLERQAAGEDVWVYTCLDPGGPWLNRMLDQQRLRQVWFGWAAVRFDVTGYLHWGLNYYREGVDPWLKSVVPFFSAGGPRNEKNQLPAGDAYIVYPGADGPVSTSRHEAMRMGMEDYILLKMLGKSDEEAVSGMIERLVRSYKDYSFSIPEYREVREQLLESLSGN